MSTKEIKEHNKTVFKNLAIKAVESVTGINLNITKNKRGEPNTTKYTRRQITDAKVVFINLLKRNFIKNLNTCNLYTCVEICAMFGYTNHTSVLYLVQEYKNSNHRKELINKAMQFFLSEYENSRKLIKTS